MKLPGSGDALVSLIHEVDYSRAVLLAVESAPRASIYNVVDDAPVTYRDLYAHIATLAGVDTPLPGGPDVRSLAVSNARIKKELGWTPAYPSYRSGIVG
jgi:nucleoside-diphosphate-sugar epimerase